MMLHPLKVHATAFISAHEKSVIINEMGDFMSFSSMLFLIANKYCDILLEVCEVVINSPIGITLLLSVSWLTSEYKNARFCSLIGIKIEPVASK